MLGQGVMHLLSPLVEPLDLHLLLVVQLSLKSLPSLAEQSPNQLLTSQPALGEAIGWSVAYA